MHFNLTSQIRKMLGEEAGVLLLYYFVDRFTSFVILWKMTTGQWRLGVKVKNLSLTP